MTAGDVFRALSDPTRRALLDALSTTDGQSLGDLCAVAPEMSRFGVMKHLRVLVAADLVVATRVGRETRHFLNPVPIERIAHRWVSRYARPFAAGLLDLEAQVTSTTTRSTAMPDVAHVYQIFIAAPPDRVWAALTESDWTRRYFHGTAYVSPPAAGAPWATVLPDGEPAVDGDVLEMVPPGPETDGRFVVTWHIRYDDELAQETPGRVEWTLTEAGPGLTRVRLVHHLDDAPRTAEHVRDGWVWVLDNLKTVLETGRSMPRPSVPV